MILQAEVYENAQAPPEHTQAHRNHEDAKGANESGHVHENDAQAWWLEDGWQRMLSTFAGDLIVAIGFVLLLSALYNMRAHDKAWHGPLWGLAGYATFLPATGAEDLSSRQNWWGGTEFATSSGSALIVHDEHWSWHAAALLVSVAPQVRLDQYSTMRLLQMTYRRGSEQLRCLLKKCSE